MSRIIIKNFPSTFTEKELIKQFSLYGQITDCRVLRNENGKSKKIAFIGYKSLQYGIRAKNQFNDNFMGSSKVQIDFVNEKKQIKHVITSSSTEKNTKIKAPIIAQKNKKYIEGELKLDPCRLYITNLPYTVQETEIRKAFESFGKVVAIKIPQGQNKKNRGYAFLTFQKEEQAAIALSQLDNTILFGRYIHIQNSVQDIGQIIRQGKEADYQTKKVSFQKLEDKSSYKRKKKKEMRLKLHDTSSWNTLFLNPNTILERMSAKLKLTKSEILLSEGLAAKMTMAQTQVIQETKEWMKSVGINLDFLQKDRTKCERSDKILIIKNLNYRSRQSQIQQLMGYYGLVLRILLAPNRTVAIVQFQNSSHAANALLRLQNAKFKNNFLYLEYAPISLLSDSEKKSYFAQSIEQNTQNNKTTTIYLKNLNFQTSQNNLHNFLQCCGEIKYVKIIKGKQGQSLGYAFAEFSTQESAKQAVKRLHNNLLDGHKIQISLSRKKAESLQKINKIRKITNPNQLQSNKLIIKNLAFQAQKSDLQELLNQYGCVSKIRVPRKINGSHRGFAFVQFASIEEAALAKEFLSNSHIYGRKLVIEFEQKEQTINC